jgi:hypothetical protein
MHNYLAATLVRKGPSRLHFSHIRRLSSSKISHINRMTRRKRRVGGEPNSSPTLTTNRCVQRSCWCPTLIGRSGRSSPGSDEYPHSKFQFGTAQGGALATKLAAITRASCTSTTLAWPRTVISLPCAQFLVGRRRSQPVPAQARRRPSSRAVAVMRRSGCG